MVLTTGEGGAAAAGRAPGPAARRARGPVPAGSSVARRRARGRGEAGSQVLEFAMVLPLLGIGLALLAQTGLLLADLLAVHGLAREAARTLAVEGDISDGDLADRLAPTREVRFDVDRGDGVVEVRAELTTPAFAAAGVELRVPARATFHDEAGPGG